MAHVVTRKYDALETVPYTPGSDVVQGTVVVQEDLVGVMVRATATGKVGALAIAGIWDFPKTAVTAYTVGKPVYWDVADEEATEDSDTGTNKQIGKVAASALSADTVVSVLISQ